MSEERLIGLAENANTYTSPMSRPILARLGFREVCEIRILLNRFE